MAAHAVTKANEDMYRTIVGRNSDATEYRPRPPPMSVVEPPFDMRSEMARTLADLSVVMRTDAEAIVKNGLTT